MKGSNMKRIPVVLTIVMLSSVALATMLAPSEKADPLTGEKVSSQDIISYGSYIYGWPSKYDLIFWPLTEENWICMNPKNGYAAFNDDFEKLSRAEKKSLADWLRKNYKPENPPASHEEKLAWLERVYGQRKMDDDFWCRFYRLMAYVHRYDKKTSTTYVKKALPLLEKALQSNPEGNDKLEVLYLLGEYHRRLGDAKKSEEFFAKVKDVKYKNEEGDEKTGHPYFIELVEDRRKLRNRWSGLFEQLKRFFK
jgi:tetratricopeptide (TPR) repeat protein